MHRTALYEKHLALGAKIVPFAGFEMPLQYEGLTPEHLAVRQSVGLFDVSHMGEFMVEGPEALDLIQKVTSNDASTLFDGKVQYSCLPNPNGGIIDDLLVYRSNAQSYMLVVNASNIEKDFNWINSQNTFNCKVSNVSNEYSLLALQGPKAIDIVQKLTDMPVQQMGYYTFKEGILAGIPVILSVTGYTGSGGFEIYVKNQYAPTLWDILLTEGAPFEIKPCGLAARDTLRLEMGFCLYGNDITDTTSPLEAGLGWITKFTKPFTASTLLQAQKTAGITRKLVGIELIDRGIPRHDYRVLDAGGNPIGFVTSGTMAPSLKKAIGLAYIDTSILEVKAPIYIEIRDKHILAQVVPLPFYKA